MSDEVRETFLTRDEQKRLAMMGTTHAKRGAIRIWTLKEAFSKLLGLGFSSEFQEMDFRLFPEPSLASKQSFRAPPTHFESLYIEGPDTLYLTTLAIAPQSSASTGQIQFLHLLEDTNKQTDLICLARADLPQQPGLATGTLGGGQ